MRNDAKRRSLIACLLILSALAAILSSLAGCSSFRSKKRLDLAPFAEEMIAVAGDIQFGLGQTRAIYLRDYVNGPEIDDFRAHALRARMVVRGIIAYSLEIVTMADADISGDEKARALADYLEDVIRPVLAKPQPNLHMTESDLDTILARVRSQDDFMPALQAAQPIIEEVAYAADEILHSAKESLDRARDAIAAKIEREHADVKKADDMLKASQVATVLNISYLGQYRLGSQAAMDSLLAREPSLREIVASADRVRPEHMAAIEERMLFKLRALREVREQLEPDITLYWNQHRELGELENALSTALRKALVAIVAFARAHDRMSKGVVDPAKINLLGIAKKAAGGVSPVPIP